MAVWEYGGARGHLALRPIRPHSHTSLLPQEWRSVLHRFDRIEGRAVADGDHLGGDGDRDLAYFAVIERQAHGRADAAQLLLRSEAVAQHLLEDDADLTLRPDHSEVLCRLV